MKAAYKAVPEEKTSLISTKWIKASPARVFEAWTKPEFMNKWFTPDMNKMTPQTQADFRVGGSYRIFMKRVENNEGPIVGGKYLEIVPAKKIVFGWAWEGLDSCASATEEKKPGEPVSVDSVVTVEFIEKNGGTEVVLTHERLPNAEQVERHTEGWTGCLESLAAYASKA